MRRIPLNCTNLEADPLPARHRVLRDPCPWPLRAWRGVCLSELPLLQRICQRCAFSSGKTALIWNGVILPSGTGEKVYDHTATIRSTDGVTIRCTATATRATILQGPLCADTTRFSRAKGRRVNDTHDVQHVVTPSVS